MVRPVQFPARSGSLPATRLPADTPYLAITRGLEGAGARRSHGEPDASRDGFAAVGTLAIGKGGAINAALLAVAILTLQRPDLHQKLEAFRKEQAEKILNETL